MSVGRGKQARARKALGASGRHCRRLRIHRDKDSCRQTLARGKTRRQSQTETGLETPKPVREWRRDSGASQTRDRVAATAGRNVGRDGDQVLDPDHQPSSPARRALRHLSSRSACLHSQLDYIACLRSYCIPLISCMTGANCAVPLAVVHTPSRPFR